MAFILGLMLNLMLIGSLFAFLGAGVLMVRSAEDQIERWIRIGALFAGLMIAIGAQLGGISVSAFIVDALSSTRASGKAAIFAGAAIPGIAGVTVGWYLTHAARRSDVAIRVMALISTLAAAEFAQIYIASLRRNGLSVGTPAIPNLAFIVGLILWYILRYDKSRKPQRPQWMQRRSPVPPPREPGTESWIMPDDHRA
jgi:hypothetical protein